MEKIDVNIPQHIIAGATKKWISVFDIEPSERECKVSEEVLRFRVGYCNFLISENNLMRMPTIRVLPKGEEVESGSSDNEKGLGQNGAHYECLDGWEIICAMRELFKERQDDEWKYVQAYVFKHNASSRVERWLARHDPTKGGPNVTNPFLFDDLKDCSQAGLGRVFQDLEKKIENIRECEDYHWIHIKKGGYFSNATAISEMAYVQGVRFSSDKVFDFKKGACLPKGPQEIIQELYDFAKLFGFDDLPCLQELDVNLLEAYDEEAFLGDVYMDKERYQQLCSILSWNKNVILQGAPGVGKTFAARRLAWSIMGKKDDSRIKLVQFHQSYSYEDFIMGYRPEGDGFELKHGIFYRFCQKAANQPDKPFFLIIDEINRGNLSKIFGELLALIEVDYRGYGVDLVYSGERFSVPGNLHIIGMMNTADRSLAMIDYALRRRFKFFDMGPGFDADGFVKYRENLGSDTMNALIEKIVELNSEISDDRSLGKGFCIGHSYFCGMMAGENIDERCREIVEFDILPMLREYWFDDEEKVEQWANDLRGVFPDERG